MAQYILSILGIVIAGIVIDIIIPSGNISKFIKSVYAIFVVAIIINPLINFVSNKKDFNIKYVDYEISEKLLSYIHNQQIKSKQENIIQILNLNGFENVDIILNYSTKNSELVINSCSVNLENVVISKESQHINIYEFIIEVVNNETNLTNEVIMFYE